MSGQGKEIVKASRKCVLVSSRCDQHRVNSFRQFLFPLRTSWVSASTTGLGFIESASVLESTAAGCAGSHYDPSIWEPGTQEDNHEFEGWVTIKTLSPKQSKTQLMNQC